MSLDHGIESMPSTSLDASPGTCSRCGFRAEPEAEACPRCGTTLEARAARRPELGTAAAQADVEQSIACPPAELEALARREAVDGWELVDTTIDPAQPEQLLAHFRKRAPAGPDPSPKAGTSTGPQAAPGAKPRAESGPKTRAEQTRPAPTQPGARPRRVDRRGSRSLPEVFGPATNSTERETQVYWGVMLVSAVILLNALSWPGLFVLGFVVPGAARRISRLPATELWLLAIAAALVVGNIGWPGLFIGLWVLPSLVHGILKR